MRLHDTPSGNPRQYWTIASNGKIRGSSRQLAVIYGNASQEVVLEAAGIAHARLLLITTPSIVVTQAIVDQVRRDHAELHIVARAESIKQMHSLHDRGVYEVVQPEFEAGLEITRQALLHLHIPASEIQRFTDTVRRELYAPLYESRPDYPAIAQLQNAARLLDLTWVPLPADSPVVGKSIRELAIRSQAGVSVVSLMRNGALQLNPDAANRFTAGDWVAVIGTAEQITAFQGMVEPMSP